MANQNRQTIDKVFIMLGIVMVVVLLAAGALAYKAYNFAQTSVTSQLSSQKIYFPASGSAEITALPAADQTAMNQYAGEQLVNGDQAKVYANNFIAYHLSEVADGQTYSQVSAASLADPSNATLKAESQTLFQGETLRGLLLGDGYAYWTFGNIAHTAALALFIGAGAMAILVILGWQHLARTKR